MSSHETISLKEAHEHIDSLQRMFGAAVDGDMLHRFIDEQAAELAALREQVRWIPVEEQPLFKPDGAVFYDVLVDDLVLMLIPCVGGPFICVGQINDTNLGIEDMQGDDLGYSAAGVTHWMPLPTPPEDTK